MAEAGTDYLVIGTGTAGLAFADTLIAEDPGARIAFVDRHGKPGGHWNDAYSFVTLHQPSAFYGVNSLELGSGRKDTIGLNKGLYELASGPEISGYFERVMHGLLASGRVSYHPLCNWLGEGEFESLLSGARTRIEVRRKVVDARYYSPAVPATHKPRFAVSEGVRVVPPGALPGLWQALQAGAPAPRRFVVLGAGKTAMDACVWLIQCGCPPEAIRWVVPRDPWVTNRVTTQNAPEFFEQAIGSQADQMQAFAEANSTDDLFLRLEACGVLLRIFADHEPTMFHLATVAPGEVEVLRRIGDVIRLGRVTALEADRMLLERGSVPVEPATLFVDCTASAVDFRPPQEIFQGERIVLQMVRLPQPAFSAALTAYVEAHYDDDAQKNRLCGSVPFPHRPRDYPRSMLVTMANQVQWGQDEGLRRWIRASRLDGFGKLVAGADRNDPQQQAIIARFREQAGAAMAHLPRLVEACEREAARGGYS